MVLVNKFFILLSLFSLLLCVNSKKSGYNAPLVEAKDGKGIKGQYIVQFKDEVTEAEADKICRFIEKCGAKRKYRWNKGDSELGFSGVSIIVSSRKEKFVLAKVRQSPKVKRIEQDQTVKIAMPFPRCNVQTNAGWCLSKISRNHLSLYVHSHNCGFGARIYMIDTGCNWTHPDIKGRVLQTKNFVADEDEWDYEGHGTATASNAAGQRYGAAKQSKLICVKVLNKNGFGSWSDVISGINWVAAKRDKGIINMSLGGGYSEAVNDAVRNAYYNGHLPVVAAGNENVDSSNVSPASTKEAVTVAASDIHNNMAEFTNYGKLVDIVAPGVNCITADAKTNKAFEASGTSLSAPFTSGIAACIQSQFGLISAPDAPKRITDILLASARRDIQFVKPNTVNKLLYWKNCL